jgi:hypothetical protein
MNNVDTRLCRLTRPTASALAPPPEILTGSTQFHVGNGGTYLQIPAKEQSGPYQCAQKNSPDGTASLAAGGLHQTPTSRASQTY